MIQEIIMAGGIFAVSGIMFTLLGVGGLMILLGIIGIIIFALSIKKGKSYGVPLTIVSAVVTFFGFILTSIPVGFGIFLFLVNSQSDTGYVETDITIEEDGYQDTRFTADGVVYEVLDLTMSYSYSYGEAVFSYEESGFISMYGGGNYYRVENPHGFDLVTDGYGLLFCPEEDQEEIMDFYETDESSVWIYEDPEYYDYCKVSEDCAVALTSFDKTDIDSLPTIDVEEDDEIYLFVYELSSDYIIEKNSYYFRIVDDRVYLEVDSSDSMINCDFTGIVLPEALEKELLEIYE